MIKGRTEQATADPENKLRGIIIFRNAMLKQSKKIQWIEVGSSNPNKSVHLFNLVDGSLNRHNIQ